MRRGSADSRQPWGRPHHHICRARSMADVPPPCASGHLRHATDTLKCGRTPPLRAPCLSPRRQPAYYFKARGFQIHFYPILLLYVYSGSCIVLCWKGRASTPKSIRLLHRTYGPCGCCRPRTQCRICTWEMGQKSFMIGLWDYCLLRELTLPIQ